MRNQYLDSFRGTSILLVVLFHYSARLPADVLFFHGGDIRHTFFFGWIGVYLFFIISGFSIYGSLQRSQSVTEFFSKRLSRIYFPFVVASSIVFLYQLVFFVPSFREGDWSFNVSNRDYQDYIATTFFFARDLGFEWVDGAYWTLLVELKFYLAISIFAGFGWLENFKRVDFIITFLLPLIWVVSLLSGFALAELVLRNIFLAPYFPFFMLGVRIARGKCSNLVVVLNFIIILFILFLISSDKATPYEIPFITTVIFSVIAAALIFSMYAHQPAPHWVLKLWPFKFLSFLGVYSFSWYLLHQNIGISLVYAFSYKLNPYVSVLCAGICTFCAAMFFSWLFEHRFRKRSYLVFSKIFTIVIGRARRFISV